MCVVLVNCQMLFELTGKLFLEVEPPFPQCRSKHAYVMCLPNPSPGAGGHPKSVTGNGKQQAAQGVTNIVA